MNRESLATAYKPLLYKYLSLLYVKEIDWDDWKQEGELILRQLIAKYEPEKGDLSSYLKKSLYFSLKSFRKKLLEKQKIVYENFPEENHKKIRLRGLSKREKEIIKLIYFVGLSEREIAKRLKISRGSVKIYKKRALNKLRDSISKEDFVLF
ncbi:MAG: RNA polymerase subunit sigma-70 [Dictyoglomus sp. NZ13-RE01]|nr:MAG: RNA polymerase subunit sigma-70 [Dictyoglomus sp. NZ13-RE01]